jgi:hypothetical protein
VAVGFQEELRDLVEDPSIDALARERGQRLVETGSEPEVETGSEPEVETGSEPDLDA